MAGKIDGQILNTANNHINAQHLTGYIIGRFPECPHSAGS
jgi:hypothetical protein